MAHPPFSLICSLLLKDPSYNLCIIKIKLRAFKIREHTDEKYGRPYVGSVMKPIDLAAWNQSELLL